MFNNIPKYGLLGTALIAGAIQALSPVAASAALVRRELARQGRPLGPKGLFSNTPPREVRAARFSPPFCFR